MSEGIYEEETFDEFEKDLREAARFENGDVVDFETTDIKVATSEAGNTMWHISLRAINHPTKDGQFLPRPAPLLPYKKEGKWVNYGQVIEYLHSVGVETEGKKMGDVFGDPASYVGLIGKARIVDKAVKKKDSYLLGKGYKLGEPYNTLKFIDKD